MADKRESHSVQGTPTPSPPPCAKGCGFFGSPSTLNMCSKCYRDHQKSMPPEEAPAPASAPEQNVVSMVPAPQAVLPHPAAVEKPPADLLKDVGLVPPAGSSAAATAMEQEEVAPPPRKVQKNTSKCFSCKRKIGLTGFQCRCGYFFCSTHRYSDQHDCDFDFQSLAREQLEKANPVVVASKLDKI